MGRPLQPNPAGGPPIVPQALNRYAATPVGQPGVAEGVNGGLDLRLPLMGVAGNTALEIAGRTVVAQSGRLTLRGTAPALEKALSGRGLPFDVSVAGIAGGRLGELALGASGAIPFIGRWTQHQLANRLVTFEVATRDQAGIIKNLENGRFLFKKFGTTIDTAGLQVEKYQRGLLLGEARAFRTLSSVGLTGVIDIGFELYEFGSGTGQWGNPYLTLEQKRLQAVLEIGSDLGLAAGLALLPVDWYVAIPVAFVWAVTSPDIFANIPITSRAYSEARDLRPLP